MSAEAIGWVYRYSPFTGAPFAIHLALADSCNDAHDWEIWASQMTIASKARVGSRTTATAAFASLVDQGFLTLLEDNSRKQGGGSANRYRLEFPDAPVAWGRPPRDQSLVRGVTSHWSGGDQSLVRGVTSHWSGGDQSLVTDPKHEEIKRDGAAEKAERDRRREAIFDAVWQHYPKKERRKEAFKAFAATVNRCGPSVIAELEKATVNFTAAMKVERRTMQHIMYGSRFYGPSEPWRDYVNGAPDTRRTVDTGRPVPAHLDAAPPRSVLDYLS